MNHYNTCQRNSEYYREIIKSIRNIQISRFIQTTEVEPRRNQHPKQTHNKWVDWNNNKKPPGNINRLKDKMSISINANAFDKNPTYFHNKSPKESRTGGYITQINN